MCILMASDSKDTDDAQWHDDVPLLVNDEETAKHKTKRIGCLGIIVIVSLIVLIIVGAVVAVVLISVRSSDDNSATLKTSQCTSNQCTMSLVETIPTNLTYNSGSSSQHLSTFDAWNILMDKANATLNIASYYWILRGFGNTSGPTDKLGFQIFEKIKQTASRGVKIKIIQNDPTGTSWGNDTTSLAELRVAEVQSMNFTSLIGAGILHTKLWIADNLHFYVGSANTDWRSLTEVKELGLLAVNCPCLADDVSKIFTVYWEMSKPNATIPDKWPSNLSTSWNMTNPVKLKVNNTDANVYLASSPPQLCPAGRTVDIDALLNVIQSANKFICIAVMDYFSALIYSQPQMFWPIIDDALKSVVYNKGIKVRLLGSIWEHTEPDMIKFLKSLQSVNGSGENNGTLEVRLFKVPPVEPVVPYTRVNHNKYMVTDNAAYIGTSNWSGDYFVNTGGVSCIINQTDAAAAAAVNKTIQGQLLAVFNRDWYSNYTIPINNF